MKQHTLLINSRRFTCWLVLCGLVFGLSELAVAQTRKTKAPRKRQQEPAEPIDEVLETKDGLQLAVRYYPGEESQTTVPVILLHGHKGQGSDFDKLAEFLQSEAGGRHSVIVPDLRGHGQSTEIKPTPDAKPIEVSGDRLRRIDVEAMLAFDLESIKKYLLQRHNDGELNIEGLTVVGAGLGGLLGLHWTAKDWSYQRLPGIKQGQDVKAVVLLSPISKFKGLTAQVPLSHPALQKTISLLFAYGKEDSPSATNVRRLYNGLSRHRQTKFASREEEREKKDLFMIAVPTSLRGADMLTESKDPGPEVLSQFIDARVKSFMEDDYPWKARTNPLN